MIIEPSSRDAGINILIHRKTNPAHSHFQRLSTSIEIRSILHHSNVNPRFSLNKYREKSISHRTTFKPILKYNCQPQHQLIKETIKKNKNYITTNKGKQNVQQNCRPFGIRSNQVFFFSW